MEALTAPRVHSEAAWPGESIHQLMAQLDVEFGVSDHFDAYLPLRVRLGGREAILNPTADRINAWQSVLTLARSLNFPLPC